MNKRVSIIIPIYNRESLVIQTLESIKNQSYNNWECIIVDDQSSDKSYKVVKEISETDSRISVFKRPEAIKNGANACRNFGFKKSTGDYIIWFDSDDIMTPDHIESKVNYLEQKEVDFVIGKTQNFDANGKLDPYHYKKMDHGIKASDFILLKIHWYTYDAMLKREIAKRIKWNEDLSSWQDYNYFCKMLLETTHGVYLNKILTYRRIHESSIQTSMTKSKENFTKELLEIRLFTYQDISEKLDKHTRNELVYGMMNISFDLKKMGLESKYFNEVKYIVGKKKLKTSLFYFELALISARIFKGGYFLLEKAKKR